MVSALGPDGAPQSALVGIAATPELEIVFDTVEKSRKFGNLAPDPRVAFAIGWQGEITVQYEGVARQISSTELGAYHDTYFLKFTDGPARLKVGRHYVLFGGAEPVFGTAITINRRRRLLN